jgi:hypothetical protein
MIVLITNKDIYSSAISYDFSIIFFHLCVTQVKLHIYKEMLYFLYSPDLTWRDVQYLIAMTSSYEDVPGDIYQTNGAGLNGTAV